MSLGPGDKILYVQSNGHPSKAYVDLVVWPYLYGADKHSGTALTLRWDESALVWREEE